MATLAEIRSRLGQGEDRFWAGRFEEMEIQRVLDISFAEIVATVILCTQATVFNPLPYRNGGKVEDAWTHVKYIAYVISSVDSAHAMSEKEPAEKCRRAWHIASTDAERRQFQDRIGVRTNAQE